MAHTLGGLAGVVRFYGDGSGDVMVVRQMLSQLAPWAASVATVTTMPSAQLGVLHGAVGRAGEHLVLSLDGRLDNPDTIAAATARPRNAPPADLLASLWAQDRPDPALPVGDFALAAWWPSRRRLLLQRDALGMRPLYYASTPDVFWWASSLLALLAPGWLPRTINEGYFAEYLAAGLVTLNETPIVGAWRLPPAHRLDVVDGRIDVSRYWEPDVDDERAIDDETAIEMLRAHLDEAVRARLISSAPPAFQLSGGLDSSTVVGVARRLGVDRPATYSLVFPDTPAADESAFIGAVEHQHGCDAHRLVYRPSAAAGLATLAPMVERGESPLIATGDWMQDRMVSCARDEGHQVLLTGMGGDDYLVGSERQATDLLTRGRVWPAWRHAMAYRSTPWLDSGAAGTARAVLAPLIPRPVTRMIRRWRPSPLPSWLRPAFITETHLRDRLRQSQERVGPRASHVVQESLVRFWSGDCAHIRESLHAWGRDAGIEFRHPFHDRRLVAFLVGLPDHLRMRHGVHRFVMRRAFAGDLPPTVAARVDKPDLDPVLWDGATALAPDRLLSEPLDVVQRGWIDPEILLALWHRQRTQRPSGPHTDVDTLFAIWQVGAAEALIRALTSDSA